MTDRYFSEIALAALYDLFSPRQVRDDFDFYLPMALSADAVLDIGCGTGSFLHEVRDAGHQGRLCGLDPGAGMLEVARRRRDIEWVQGDLSGATWDREFNLAIMTGHAFQVLVEDIDLRDALAAVRTALTVGGRFAFETRNPLAREWERWGSRHAREVTDASGAVVRMTTAVHGPFDGRTVSFSHTFASPAWDQPQVSRSTLRFLGADELTIFLREAGFEIEALYGDWDRSALTDGSPEIIVVARRVA